MSHESSEEDELSLEELHERIVSYEAFLKRVQGDRQLAENLLKEAKNDIQAWDDLERSLSLMNHDGYSGPASLPVELGAGVVMEATINPKAVFISIGMGFHLECRMDEGTREVSRVIGIRRDQSRIKAESAQARFTKIQQQELLIQEGLSHLKSTLPS